MGNIHTEEDQSSHTILPFVLLECEEGLHQVAEEEFRKLLKVNQQHLGSSKARDKCKHSSSTCSKIKKISRFIICLIS